MLLVGARKGGELAKFLALFVVVGPLVTLLAAHGAEGAGAPSANDKKLAQVVKMMQSGNYGSRRAFSIVNDYLCRYVASEEPAANLAELGWLSGELRRRKELRSETLAGFMIRFGIFEELIAREQDGSICLVDGQNALKMAQVEWTQHVKMVRQLGDKFGAEKVADRRACERVKRLLEHFNERRVARCERGGFFAKLVIDHYDHKIEPETQRKLLGALGAFADFLQSNAPSCQRAAHCYRLADDLDSIESFDAKTGELLLDGLRLLDFDSAAEGKQRQRQQQQQQWDGDSNEVKKLANDADEPEGPMGGSAAEAIMYRTSRAEQPSAFLKRFVAIRNAMLLRPCETYLARMREPMKEIRMYESLFGDLGDQVMQFAAKERDARRLQRAWTLFNACEIIDERLARVSVALLRAAGFEPDAEQSPRLDKRQMVAILKSSD